jgi:RHS repeat-associated protein
MEQLRRITHLPAPAAPQPLPPPPNPARAVQGFVGQVMSVVFAPLDMANLGLAKLTQGLSNALPSFPAVRLFRDMVLGWPHSHPHPPTFGFPLPSIGPVICAGAVNVLINGLPAVRSGDVGFGVWCGGYYPLFEVFTGSSNVFIGGARAARKFVDFTKHCLPGIPGIKGVEAAKKGFKGLGKLDKAMMALPVVFGALGVAAALGDQAGYQEMADSAESESEAKEAAAKSEAAGIEAKMAGLQMAADLAAMALSVGMGKDPGITPFTCWGNFIMGSPNVLIGGFPMPGWMSFLRGMRKVLKRSARKIQLKLPQGSRRRRALCFITGHPVDIATGRVFTSQTDFELPGRIPIEFTRVYTSSAIDYEGPLGRGWMHPYDVHLWQDEGQGMVVLRNKEGLLSGFGLIGIGEKTFNPLDHQWLERLEDKVYVVRGKDGVRYKFASIKERDSVIEVVDDPEGASEATALRLSEIEDRNGNRIKLFYEGGRLAWLEDAAGTRLNFSYITLDNGAERLAGVNLALNEDSTRTSRLVNFTYDSEGRLTNATDRGLIPWRYAYDQDLLVRETNRNGLSFHFEYKGEGREARCAHTWGDGGIYERWLDYDRESKMTVVEDSLKARTTYYFNELDLPLRIVDALGGEKQFTYGLNGELLSETDQIGRETKYLYNAQYDCVSLTHPDGTTRRFDYTGDSLPVKLADEAGAEFKREYDESGNITATVDALGHRREYSYNQFGDLERVVDPLGGAMKLKWNNRGQIIEFTSPRGATTVYGYDERARLVRISDPVGRATRYAYDTVDRLAQIERPGGAKNHYEFDPEGNLTSFLDANGAETRFRYVDNNKLGDRVDALGYRRRFIYDTEANLVEIRNERGEAYKIVSDALGRLTREVGFDGLTWEYAYDPASQLSERTDPAGRVTRFIRDRRGRVIERQRPDGTTVGLSYDIVGRLTEARVPGSELVFKYDALGQVVFESQNGQVVEHEYDPLGRRVKRNSPFGRMVEFTYDADSHLSRLQTPSGSMTFEYDRAGQVIRRNLPGSLEEVWQYDGSGRMVEQSLWRRDKIVFHRGYKYDAEGNLIELNDSANGLRRFTYDPVERLSDALHPEKGLEKFIFDSTGNLLQRGDRKFQYDSTDRLVGTDDSVLIYDEVGNLVEKRRKGSVIRYSYDTDNQLIAVESKEGGRVEFTYDALGRRTAKMSNKGEVGFIWDGDVLLSERYESGTNEYVFKGNNFEPLVKFGACGFEAYHNDYLGTPREITNDDGQIVWSAVYDVYGKITERRASKSENQLRFPGQYEDTECGLYYNFFRYYDPDAGRYISQDPIGIEGGLNLYGYTSNPLTWIDPLGLEREYVVYGLYRPGATTPYYVGQTAADQFSATTGRHSRPSPSGDPPRLPENWRALGYEHRAIHEGLTYQEARGLEQHYIEKNGTLTGRPGNEINQIDPKRTDERAVRYRDAAKKYLQDNNC